MLICSLYWKTCQYLPHWQESSGRKSSLVFLFTIPLTNLIYDTTQQNRAIHFSISSSCSILSIKIITYNYNQVQNSSHIRQPNEISNKHLLSRSFHPKEQTAWPWDWKPEIPAPPASLTTVFHKRDEVFNSHWTRTFPSTSLSGTCLVCKNYHALKFCSITRVRVKFNFQLAGTLCFGLNEMYQHQHSFPFLGKLLPHRYLR